MWLFDIIKDGTLVDNQRYEVNGDKLTNQRLATVQLRWREPKQRETTRNKECAIWDFLDSVSRNVNKKLEDHSPEALVLFNDEDYEHNTDNFIILTGTNARNFTLRTGNLIEFVKRGAYCLKISSRFGDAFLQYIIADANGFLELENMGGESHSDGYEWLLAYLWNIKFKQAYRLGLPKAYITRNDRISRVRGTIDAVDYFRNRTSGKYLCSYREHNYEQSAMSLFSLKPMRQWQLNTTKSASIQGISTMFFLWQIRA